MTFEEKIIMLLTSYDVILWIIYIVCFIWLFYRLNVTSNYKKNNMKKSFTITDYENYMKVVNRRIKDIEDSLKTIDKHKKISNLSFEDWVKYQNGELKIYMKDLEVKIESMAPDGVVVDEWSMKIGMKENEGKNVTRLFLHIGECLYRIDNKGFIIDRIVPHENS